MTNIKSKERHINYSPDKVFNFLSNFNNFKDLMPEKVSDWTSTEETCYFSISGIASLGMKIIEKQAPLKIKMVDNGKVPFKFDFIVDIQESGENSIVNLTFDAELNPMLKLVAVSPLKSFLEELLDHLEKIEL